MGGVKTPLHVRMDKVFVHIFKFLYTVRNQFTLIYGGFIWQIYIFFPTNSYDLHLLTKKYYPAGYKSSDAGAEAPASQVDFIV